MNGPQRFAVIGDYSTSTLFANADFVPISHVCFGADPQNYGLMQQSLETMETSKAELVILSCFSRVFSKCVNGCIWYEVPADPASLVSAIVKTAQEFRHRILAENRYGLTSLPRVILLLPDALPLHVLNRLLKRDTQRISRDQQIAKTVSLLVALSRMVKHYNENPVPGISVVWNRSFLPVRHRQFDIIDAISRGERGTIAFPDPVPWMSHGGPDILVSPGRETAHNFALFIAQEINITLGTNHLVMPFPEISLLHPRKRSWAATPLYRNDSWRRNEAKTATTPQRTNASPLTSIWSPTSSEDSTWSSPSPSSVDHSRSFADVLSELPTFANPLPALASLRIGNRFDPLSPLSPPESPKKEDKEENPSKEPAFFFK